MNKRLIKRWGMATIVAFLIALYFIIDPARQAWMPKCVWLQLTGWKCPGCGSQRMIHALLHGDVSAAWSYNPFFVAVIPIIIFLIWLETARTTRPRLYATIYRPGNILIATLTIILWAIIRNILHL